MDEKQIRVDSDHRIAPSTAVERSAYGDLYRLAISSRYDPDEAHQIVAAHPSIAERLLRVTNSLRHALDRHISSTRHALLLLGARGVRQFCDPVIRYDPTVSRADPAQSQSEAGLVDPPHAIPAPKSAKQNTRQAPAPARE